MKTDSLEQLYLSDLQDLYDAEKQLLKALPKVARAVSSPKLKQGFERHARQTQEHAKRLEKIFQQHGQKAGGRKCPAMAGLIAEANDTLQEDFTENLLDVCVITAAQKVEHYEISGYTSAISLAQTLDLQADVSLLEKTLQEEEQTEQQLSSLCEALVQEQQSQSRTNAEWMERAGGSRKSGRTGGRSNRSGGSDAGRAHATRDHQEIQRWAEERDGEPALVKGTGGLLRIDFPGFSGERTLQHVSWDRWFEIFDKNNLVFLCQDRTKDGRTSRFFKLVCEPEPRRSGTAKRRQATRSR
jgi:ferritin-like metal-binding protein YciE